jgi:hypothetical protein
MNMHPQFRRLACIGAAGAALATAALATTAAQARGGALPEMAVPVTDTVKGETEYVAFSGQAKVNGKLIDDPSVNGPPQVELAIDFSNVSGTGVSSGKKYVTSAQTVLTRPLKSFDPFEVSFPFYQSGDLGSARTALAAFALNYGAATGLRMTAKLTAP